ncbi:MAG: amino acid dehydrogenase [Bacteroidetes bacterium]|jgi:glutamate dehydrogenase/leucine dehydrogenase|nr:amino acid dehydrogenase [Bacteroidota bacterium]
MKDLLKKFEEKPPLVVFEWHDDQTEAVGWVVINSLRGGAAGGGTRMRLGLNKHEVVSLAKTMEIKFSCAGPAIGGAKSGINFNPADPRKEGVLRRWYAAVLPLLKNYYGTGGDLNIDEAREVVPITSSMGLEHPQEGVLMGHFCPDSIQKKKKIGQLQQGVSMVLGNSQYSPDPARKYLVADMITGWGVHESVRLYFENQGQSLKDMRVIVQGWGNVAAAAAWYQAQAGARVVGIIDRVGGLLSQDGFSFEEITRLFNERQGNYLESSNLLSFDEVNAKIWDMPAQVFLPCAASRLVQMGQLERMKQSGVEVIACGANVPFADEAIFYGPTAAWADAHFAVIPDFIANMGMARTFAYLMEDDITLTEAGIFGDVTAATTSALRKVLGSNQPKLGLMARGFEIALAEIGY